MNINYSMPESEESAYLVNLFFFWYQDGWAMKKQPWRREEG